MVNHMSFRLGFGFIRVLSFLQLLLIIPGVFAETGQKVYEFHVEKVYPNNNGKVVQILCVADKEYNPYCKYELIDALKPEVPVFWDSVNRMKLLALKPLPEFDVSVFERGERETMVWRVASLHRGMLRNFTEYYFKLKRDNRVYYQLYKNNIDKKHKELVNSYILKINELKSDYIKLGRDKDKDNLLENERAHGNVVKELKEKVEALEKANKGLKIQVNNLGDKGGGNDGRLNLEKALHAAYVFVIQKNVLSYLLSMMGIVAVVLLFVLWLRSKSTIKFIKREKGKNSELKRLECAAAVVIPEDQKKHRNLVGKYNRTLEITKYFKENFGFFSESSVIMKQIEIMAGQWAVELGKGGYKELFMNIEKKRDETKGRLGEVNMELVKVKKEREDCDVKYEKIKLKADGDLSDCKEQYMTVEKHLRAIGHVLRLPLMVGDEEKKGFEIIKNNSSAYANARTNKNELDQIKIFVQEISQSGEVPESEIERYIRNEWDALRTRYDNTQNSLQSRKNELDQAHQNYCELNNRHEKAESNRIHELQNTNFRLSECQMELERCREDLASHELEGNKLLVDETALPNFSHQVSRSVGIEAPQWEFKDSIQDWVDKLSNWIEEITHNEENWRSKTKEMEQKIVEAHVALKDVNRSTVECYKKLEVFKSVETSLQHFAGQQERPLPLGDLSSQLLDSWLEVLAADLGEHRLLQQQNIRLGKETNDLQTALEKQDIIVGNCRRDAKLVHGWRTLATTLGYYTSIKVDELGEQPSQSEIDSMNNRVYTELDAFQITRIGLFQGYHLLRMGMNETSESPHDDRAELIAYIGKYDLLDFVEQILEAMPTSSPAEIWKQHATATAKMNRLMVLESMLSSYYRDVHECRSIVDGVQSIAIGLRHLAALCDRRIVCFSPLVDFAVDFEDKSLPKSIEGLSCIKRKVLYHLDIGDKKVVVNNKQCGIQIISSGEFTTEPEVTKLNSADWQA